MDLARSRLAVRLGPGHALTLAYVDLTTTIAQTVKENASAEESPRTGVTDLVITFAQLAHDWASRPVE